MFHPPRTSPQQAQGVILRRCSAFVLDFIVMTIIGVSLFCAIGVFGFLTFGIGWAAYHLLPWLPFIYYILLVGGTGATPGQRLCGLSLRQEANAAPPTFAQAGVWCLFFWFSVTLAGLPFLLVFFNQRGRAAHDILSGLVFVRYRQVFY